MPIGDFRSISFLMEFIRYQSDSEDPREDRDQEDC
jgi:hypothetical protein